MKFINLNLINYFYGIRIWKFPWCGVLLCYPTKKNCFDFVQKTRKEAAAKRLMSSNSHEYLNSIGQGVGSTQIRIKLYAREKIEKMWKCDHLFTSVVVCLSTWFRVYVVLSVFLLDFFVSSYCKIPNSKARL